jgi:hypothetical protein
MWIAGGTDWVSTEHPNLTGIDSSIKVESSPAYNKKAEGKRRIQEDSRKT